MYSGFNFYQNMETNCECCSNKMTISTWTIGTITHKWTKKEIEETIINLSKELLNVKWYNRSDIIRQLKHWHNKLKKYNEVKEEFNFKEKKK